MEKTWTKPRLNLDIDIDIDIDNDIDINIMYKYIIFFELCPAEHNPRRQHHYVVGNWDWGLRIGTRTWEEVWVLNRGLALGLELELLYKAIGYSVRGWSGSGLNAPWY